MRSINIDDETYRFLQSKAIPYEEQPVDTIKRLLDIGSKVINNQLDTKKSNNSNLFEPEHDLKPVTGAVTVEKRQELKEFYSKILEKNNSNGPIGGSNSALNATNSNNSLEPDSNRRGLLESSSNLNINSNPESILNSNSNHYSNSNSKQELERRLYSKQDLPYPPNKNTEVRPVITSKGQKDSKISNFAGASGALKGKKKPKTSLPELIKGGILKENERVIFQNYRGVKFPQYEVTISDGLLKWNGSRFSMSDLASKLLKDLDPTQDNEFVRGPILWVNAAGKTIAELWEKYLAQKGV